LRNTTSRVVHEHVDLADLGLHLVERLTRRIPVAHVALGGDEIKAERLLVFQPLRATRRIRAAAGNHLESLLGETLADARSDAAHTARYIRNTL